MGSGSYLTVRGSVVTWPVLTSFRVRVSVTVNPSTPAAGLQFGLSLRSVAPRGTLPDAMLAKLERIAGAPFTFTGTTRTGAIELGLAGPVDDTGAARIALGPELPALFGTREETVDALLRHGRRLADPLWPMPLWAGYDEDISSKIADVNNASSSTFAGAIIGGLFLKRFVRESKDWLHVDLFGWNPKDRPGRPVGAEPQAVRSLYALLAERYG